MDAITEPVVRSAFDRGVQEVTGNDISGADSSTSLEDLDVDSLDLIEIGMIVEEEWDIVLTAEVLAEATTIDEVVTAIAAHFRGKG